MILSFRVLGDLRVALNFTYKNLTAWTTKAISIKTPQLGPSPHAHSVLQCFSSFPISRTETAP